MKRYVDRREAGLLPGRGQSVRRPRLMDEFLPKIEEWVDRPEGQIRADVVFDPLVDLGFGGSDRTVRRAVSEAKERWRRGERRVFRPWILEPTDMRLRSIGEPERRQLPTQRPRPREGAHR